MSTEIEDAVNTLKRAFKSDPDFAHGWHCNIAGACYDSIGPSGVEQDDSVRHEISNEAASRFMKMAFDVEIDGIRILHLGLPSSSPTSAILKGIEDVDVLLMPVGGGISLSGSSVTDVMETIDPHIAIPMHYKTPVETAELDFLDAFLKETGLKPEPQEKLQLTRSSVPEELTVQVLSPKLPS